jgi:NADH-quinone oxidoreductase subunit N
MINGPHIDWAGLSPFIAPLAGSVVVLLLGLLRSRLARETLVPALTVVTLAVMIGLTIWRLDEVESLVSGALRFDGLSAVLTVLFGVSGIAATLLAWRAEAPKQASHGEWHALLLTSVAGMVLLSWAQNLVSVFLGLELLSIPLYVLCATEMKRSTSLESGLKYLIIGSVGSATLLYGSALLYGATGTTDFGAMARAISGGFLQNDALLLTGIALVVVGLGFKASVAPFHQWTPDVYQGAPTAVTAFMATATKVAAFGVFLRLFDVALPGAEFAWAPALAVLATITIIVGNVGALQQTSLKRVLAWSSVAQAGYLLSGVVVATQLGARATVFYLVVYSLMNLAAFGVIVAREREVGGGDAIDDLAGLGQDRPVLAWSLTISMLGLAGIPATSGFIGKFFLIQATVDGNYAWLGVVIVIGSMLSLAYYLRIIAAVWMRPKAEAVAASSSEAAHGGSVAVGGRPALAGGSPEADALDHSTGTEPRVGAWEATSVAAICAAATLVLGVVPQPLFDFVERVGSFVVGS